MNANVCRLHVHCPNRAVPEPRNADWVLATTDYGAPFVAAVGKDNVYATQVGACPTGSPHTAVSGAALHLAAACQPHGLAKGNWHEKLLPAGT